MNRKADTKFIDIKMDRSSRPEVNFAKFLRKPFLTEHLQWLLLNGAL